MTGKLSLALPLCISVPLVVIGCGDGGSMDAGERSYQQWSASEDLRIGSVDDSLYALTWLTDLEVGESGRIYSLHPNEARVRVFDAAGQVLPDIGRRGQGPGEFENIYQMGWVGDTLWVLDRNRFEQFSATGEHLGGFTVPFEFGEDPNAPDPPRASGLLDDGTVHGAPAVFSRLVATGAVTHRRPMLMTRDGEITDTLPPVSFGNNQWAIYDPDDPGGGGSYGRQPFGDGPLSAFVPGERAVLHLDREAPRSEEEAAFTLTKLRFSGDTLFSRSFPYEPLPLTDSEVDSVLTARATALGERGFMGLTVARARAWAERTLYTPPFKTGIESMSVGRDGTIWLKRGDEGPTAPWLILNRDGQPEGEVHLPKELNVMEADRSHVWGWLSDEFDVPYIVRYRIDTTDA